MAQGDLADRAALYPALYLRGDFDVELGECFDDETLARTHQVVVVTDGELDEADLRALRAAPGQAFILPRGGLSLQAAAMARGCGARILAPRAAGPLASSFPAASGLRTLEVQGCAARLAEEQLLASEAIRDRTPPGGVVAVVGGPDDFQAIAPALRRAQARFGLAVSLFASQPWPLDMPGARMAPLNTLGLTGVAEAAIFLCALGSEPPTCDRPAIWVRTALLAGAPVVAASHPSLDGLAHLCALDDWDRGLTLYRLDAAYRLAAQVRGQAQMAADLSPSKVAASWRAALSAVPGPPARAEAPSLIALFDLAQDLDVILPVAQALVARGVARVRPVVSDWLLKESPRTIARLEAAGLEPKIIERAAALRGEVPMLDGAAGVLLASDANVEPHRVGRRLAERARSKGLVTFSLQHGLENIGLTYRDVHHGEGVDFGAEHIVTWGAADGLPAWVRAATRDKVMALGDPKSPPPAAEAPWPQGAWRRRVCVFENLHWDRYDEAWRVRFLGDVQSAADQSPDTLFLLKPHHAGRWLTRNPGRAPKGDNLIVIDPRDPQWEPFTAPALIAGADRVLTTPSTVALDTVRAGRPVAVFGYGLDLSSYWPLPVIDSNEGLLAFLRQDDEAHIGPACAFLSRTLLPGSAANRIAGAIEGQLRAASTRLATRRSPPARESVR